MDNISEFRKRKRYVAARDAVTRTKELPGSLAPETTIKHVPEAVMHQLTVYFGHAPTNQQITEIHAAYAAKVTCQRCHDAGFTRLYDANGKYGFGDSRYDMVPCHCQDERRRAVAWRKAQKASHFVAEMFDLTFESFRQQREPEAFQAAQEFVDDPAGWLMFDGPTGTGKTHLLAAMTAALINGSPVRYPLYVNAPRLLDYYRAGFDEHDSEERFMLVRDADILLVDDLGAERQSDWTDERWYLLFDYRSVRALPTVIATNMRMDDFEFRVRSRLKDTALVQHVKLTSQDFRLTPARAKARAKVTKKGA